MNGNNTHMGSELSQASSLPLHAWAVMVGGKFHSARATKHEAVMVAHNFTREVTEVIPVILTAIQAP